MLAVLLSATRCAPTPHRLFVDQIEGGVATLIDEEGRGWRQPSTQLPGEAREGTLLEQEADGGMRIVPRPETASLRQTVVDDGADLDLER